MSDEKALTTTTGSALDVYGSGDDIKTLARRIKLCLPGGDKLQDHEALALAQLSIAYQLNAFNGEVWYIPGKGTQVGIKGLRKAARHQSNYWLEHVLLTDEERRGNLVPDKAIAYKCILHRTDMMLTAAAIIKAMRDAGMENAFEVYAYRPAIGIGYWTPGESTKMKGDQAARKRAEAEALKVAFDLPFASEIGNGDRIGYVDAEWSEVQDVAPKLTGEALQERMAENVKILRGDPDDPDPLGIDTTGPAYDSPAFKAGEEPAKPEPEQLAKTDRPYSSEVVRGMIRKNSGVWNPRTGWGDALRNDEKVQPPSEKQVQAVAAIMGKAVTSEGMTQAEINLNRHAVLAYCCGVEHTGNLSKQECSAIIELWKDGESWEPNQWAAAEAAAVVSAWQVANGQSLLF